MIELFSAYIKTIVIFLIFANFIEMLMPDNNFKKYIGVIVGLLLVFTLLSPMLKLVNGMDFDISLLSGQEKEENTLSFPSSQKMQDENKMVTEIYKTNLAQKMQDDLKEDGFLTSFVQVEVEEEQTKQNYGEIKSVVVSLAEKKENGSLVKEVEPVSVFQKEVEEMEKTSESEFEKKAVVSVIEKNFGVNSEAIQVEVQR